MSTTTAPAEQPIDFDSFRSAVIDSFVPLETDTDSAERFEGYLRTAALGTVHVAEVGAVAHTVRRTPRTIRAGNPGFYKVGVQLSGHCVVSQDGHEAVLTPGDFTLYDTTHPYQLSFPDRYRMLVMMIPRHLLRMPEHAIPAMTATAISGREGMGAMASPFLRDLGARINDLPPAVAVHLHDALLDVLAATFAERLHRTGTPALETRQATLLFDIQSFIESHLSDPQLDSAAIAAAHHVSVRYLQKIFESEGTTVSRWIRRRRLERCRHDLIDPAHSHLPVAAIGARWGLPDPTHFSRLFKTQYATSPGAFRTTGTDSTSREPVADGQVLCGDDQGIPTGLRA
ncbi:helix-turn-helix domain-containing protein [Rhodococcus sp. NPDC056960]|uniref:AraC-like ligand-binding domain-containing protein n=1 Tax=Rhodococcus sp. NPDC056960 TaxID=3345982 RepID=UPI0036445977